MRAVLQRVKESQVLVAGQVVGKIDAGLLVLLGVQAGDTREELVFLADKIIHLRIFEDHAGKMNFSLLDAGGKLLVVSQFTLLADCRKGRRPNFLQAEQPAIAAQMVQQFANYVEGQGIAVETGQFGADMQVHLINDGPVTIVLDSRDHFQDRK